MGGFLCGGSGGIGSITWGGINAPGNVKSVTIMTCEEEPRLVRLEEAESLKALHTYGTTGLMVEVEMRLAPKVDYDQLILSAPDWDRLLDWTDAAARRFDWRKRLVTQFEWPIPSYFKPLAKHLRPGERDHLPPRSTAPRPTRRSRARRRPGSTASTGGPLPDPPKPPFLTDYTWNHTTLWAIKADPSITYLQSGFGPNFREQFAELRRRFPGEILFHLEWTAGNAKMMRGNAVATNPGRDRRGRHPARLLQVRGAAERDPRAAATRSASSSPTRTPYYLEEGGRHPNIADKRAFKAEVDPRALLNPGKMKTYPVNPFARERRAHDGGGAAARSSN